TGHYAKLVEVDGVKRLAKASDNNKDQSYFLAQVSLDALQHTLYPLQNITKPEVRTIADKLGLSIAKKKDSTGICFIGERQYREFLSNYLSKTEGNIVDIETQTIVGKHQGVMYYTIGQRHGLNISAFKGPYFVCGKNKDTNTVYVCVGQENPWLMSDACLVDRVNWYTDKKDIECMAKFRYRQKDNPVSVHFNEDGTLMVTISPEVSGVTPGQEVVFYDGDIVLGAGRIDTVYRNGISLQQRIEEVINE
ncbi:MAG: tRNA 2-thiouridine(34) synthase MnmA, partial [Erysipelothrix sp.]|nr:tRNA 2-thiouridine(34) synthase MnmA [Erysipelothrix sp.]